MTRAELTDLAESWLDDPSRPRRATVNGAERWSPVRGVRAIDAFMHNLPYGASSGWE